MKSKINVGDIVKYAPGWYSPGEEKYRLLVLESFADVERCRVVCLNSLLTIKPQEVLDWEMVTPANDYTLSAEDLEPWGLEY